MTRWYHYAAGEKINGQEVLCTWAALALSLFFSNWFRLRKHERGLQLETARTQIVSSRQLPCQPVAHAFLELLFPGRLVWVKKHVNMRKHWSWFESFALLVRSFAITSHSFCLFAHPFLLFCLFLLNALPLCLYRWKGNDVYVEERSGSGSSSSWKCLVPTPSPPPPKDMRSKDGKGNSGATYLGLLF